MVECSVPWMLIDWSWFKKKSSLQIRENILVELKCQLFICAKAAFLILWGSWNSKLFQAVTVLVGFHLSELHASVLVAIFKVRLCSVSHNYLNLNWQRVVRPYQWKANHNRLQEHSDFYNQQFSSSSELKNSLISHIWHFTIILH